MSPGNVAREGIPFELFRSTYPGRHVARESISLTLPPISKNLTDSSTNPSTHFLFCSLDIASAYTASDDVVLIFLSSSSIRKMVGCDLQGKLMDFVWDLMLNFEAAAICTRQIFGFLVLANLILYVDLIILILLIDGCRYQAGLPKALKMRLKDLSVLKRNRTSGLCIPKDSSFALKHLQMWICGSHDHAVDICAVYNFGDRLSKHIVISFIIMEHVENGVNELYFVKIRNINWRTSSLKLLAEKELNFLSTSWECRAVLNLSGALFQSHGGRDISSLAILERVNCVLWISGLYTLRLLDAACKKVLNLLKKGLLVYEEAKTTSTPTSPTTQAQLTYVSESVSYSKFEAKTFKVNEELRKFVGGRLYEGDLRLRQKNHMILSYDVLIIQVVRYRYSNPMIQPEPEGSTQGYPLVSVEVLRFNTTAGNPVKKILLKLNLSDHRLFKDGGGGECQKDELETKDKAFAFLYGTIEEEVYVHQPLGFVDPAYPNKVYKVIKALYGLHQAPRAWYETLSSFLMENGFRREFEECMHKRFQMSSMGELTFFLGLQVKQQSDGIFISQDKYVADILKKFDFLSIRTATTPIESNKPLVKDEDGVDVDVHVYRSMIGSLMYLTASRPDIMFAVCACARFQVTPKASHLNAVKRIFRYLKHQPKLGLWYPRDSPFELEAYSDSDYGGASLDRKSTTGGCQFLGRRLISWQCKKQTIVANSTTEAEYVAAANCCGQVLWIQNQMMDYGFNFMNTKIHIDNESTISVIKNPVAHSRTKHIEIRFHFIRDCYEKRLIEVIKIHTDHNVADLLTKGFDVTRISMDLRMDRSCAANSSYTWSYSDKHNMVAFLKKPNESVGFTEVVDFLKGTSLRYALTHNPTINDSLVIQFWQTATVRTLANGIQQLVASIDSKEYTITEASVRSKLQLADAIGIPNLSDAEIYARLATLGYVTEGATTDQGEGSAQPAEPYPTPVDPLPSTSLPHQSPPHSPHQSPSHSPHHSPHQSPPHSPHHSPHQSPHQSPPHSPHHSPPHSSPPKSYEVPLPEGNTSESAEASIQLKELMVLVPSLVTRVTSLEKELKDKDQGRIIQDINDDPLVSLVRESMKMKEKSTYFVFVFNSYKDSKGAQEESIIPTILEAAKNIVKVAYQGVSKVKSTI
ncbi:putative ribonuclease H-like domain-containing protein [Tanacetum coccineum]